MKLKKIFIMLNYIIAKNTLNQIKKIFIMLNYIIAVKVKLMQIIQFNLKK